MTKVLVLGGGLVGSVIARDLAADADHGSQPRRY